MNVREAIAQAKHHAGDVFSDENMFNLGVEEVERDGEFWRITLGLSRPWDKQKSMFSTAIAEDKPINRSYHVFTIADKDGEVINVRLRDK